MRATLPLLLALSSLTQADDWPQWRGPAGDNVSLEDDWNALGAEQALFRVEIGRGYSAPVIAAGRLYTTGYFEDESTPGEGVDRVQCFDAGSGELVWAHEYASLAYDNEHEGGALSTPTCFEGVLYVPSRGGEVRAYDAQSGELRWEVDLVERHGVDPGRYGFASSPYVLDDAVVLNADRTVCLERADGATRWITPSLEARYSTVRELWRGEQRALVVFGKAGLVLLNAVDGEEISRAIFANSERNVEGATPIVMGERAIISSGYDQGIACFDYGPEEPELVWRSRRLRTKMAGSTLYEGHLYGFDESMLKCLDLEGNELWRKRGLGHGAVSVAGGRLLVTSSKGELIVAQASPAGYEELSRRRIVEAGGVYWAAPVLAQGRIYFRASEGALVCLDHRGDNGVVAAAAPGLREDAPLPELLLARYGEATGLDGSAVPSMKFAGTLQNDSLGIGTCEAHWETGPDGRWRVRFYLKPYMAWMTQVFDGSIGWEANPFRGNTSFEAQRLAEFQRTRGLRSAFWPVPEGAEQLHGLGREIFHDLECFRLDVVFGEDAVFGEDTVRQLYFDVNTHLLVGRTGEHEDTVLFDDWREVGELRLPFRRVVYSADNGEQWTWAFDRAEFAALDDADFEVPEDLDAPEDSEGEDPEGDNEQ